METVIAALAAFLAVLALGLSSLMANLAFERARALKRIIAVDLGPGPNAKPIKPSEEPETRAAA
jgi:hypothetical protein